MGCDVSSCSLVAAFLEEFFHEDHGYNAMHVVSVTTQEARSGQLVLTMMQARILRKFVAVFDFPTIL